MNLAITGGGTGGHLAIVRAVAENLNARGIRPYFIGSQSGQDRKWFENSPLFEAIIFLPTRGVVNQKGLGKLTALFQIARTIVACLGIFKTHQIASVFSVGGFSAAPASIAAILARKPLFIHEQNAAIGSLNTLLRPLAKSFYSSYDSSSPVRDYPVSRRFFDAYRHRTTVRTLIVLGGSQGAVALNDFVLSIATQLRDRGIQILHQSGEKEKARVQSVYAQLGVEAEVFGFDPDLLSKIARADFAISRAGASTLWELVACGVPTLFVPYPFAASDHQYHNAAYLSELHLATLVRQEALKAEVVWKALEGDVGAQSAGLRSMLAPEGAERIVEDWLAKIG